MYLHIARLAFCLHTSYIRYTYWFTILFHIPLLSDEPSKCNRERFAALLANSKKIKACNKDGSYVTKHCFGNRCECLKEDGSVDYAFPKSVAHDCSSK